jgi:hypothetical protein
MRDPTPQQIETVHRTHDTGKPIVHASRVVGLIRQSEPRTEKVSWLATAGQPKCLCSERGDYT